MAAMKEQQFTEEKPLLPEQRGQDTEMVSRCRDPSVCFCVWFYMCVCVFLHVFYISVCSYLCGYMCISMLTKFGCMPELWFF